MYRHPFLVSPPKIDKAEGGWNQPTAKNDTALTTARIEPLDRTHVNRWLRVRHPSPSEPSRSELFLGGRVISFSIHA